MSRCFRTFDSRSRTLRIAPKCDSSHVYPATSFLSLDMSTFIRRWVCAMLRTRLCPPSGGLLRRGACTYARDTMACTLLAFECRENMPHRAVPEVESTEQPGIGR
ncbi:hypothetical protein VTO73DRAFT_11948 [Trametes versicolor]